MDKKRSSLTREEELAKNICKQNHKNINMDVLNPKQLSAKALKTTENNFWKKKCKDMQFYADKGNTHKLYQEIEQIYGPQKCKMLNQSFLKKDGSDTSSTTETLERLQEYYSELFNRKSIIIADKIEQYLERI